MSKPAQVLQIDPPQEIVFKGPFTEVVTSELTLSNPTEREVCFKVKTTAPKQYCVKPNSGVVPPHASVHVAIMLQPMSDEDGSDGGAHGAGKHKFMVQTCYMPADGGDPTARLPIDAVWRSVDASELMDTKLKVVFEGGPPQQQQQHYTAQGSFSAAADSAVHAVKSAVGAAAGGAESTTELRKAFDDRKRLQDELANVERENQHLRERVARMEAASARAGDQQQQQRASGAKGDSAPAPGGLQTYQALAGAVFALLLGLFLGRLLF